MSELRIDELTGEAVVVAPGRRAIGAVRAGGLPDVAPAECPFCPGREAETERTILAVGEPWALRVVANKFPLAAPGSVGVRGAHEVVIESRDHDGDLATYDTEHAALVLGALRSRVRALERERGVAAVCAFRNRGRRAGSSQPHPHAQIVALPYVPPAIARRAARGPRTLAHTLDRERADGARVLSDADGVIALCPYASERAWAVRLALDAPCPRFSAIDDARLRALAARLVDVVRRLRAALGPLDYNVLLRDPPVGEDLYFTLEVLPRTGGDAGFELLSGTPICVVAPEDAAATLRAIALRPGARGSDAG